MTNQIKNFIEEGSEELYRKLNSNFSDRKGLKDNWGSSLDEDIEIEIKNEVKSIASSIQISLIKMIVDEYSSIPSYSCNTYSNEGDRILPLMVQKADVDTISSKLKTLYE